MTRIPKQRRHLPPSQADASDPPSRDLCDVAEIIEHLALIARHVQDAWADDERDNALELLDLARSSLNLFRFRAEAHYDRVLRELPGRGLVDT